ncbi:MAG: SIMPL domain-containing protein [Acidimicrobiia bacterium]
MQRLLVVTVGLALAAAACTQTPDVIVETPPAEVVVQSPSEIVGQGVSGGEGETSGLGIAVGGRGRITGIPDTLQVQMGVTVSRRSVADAMEEAADLADALLAVLDEEGIAERDIQTLEFSIFPEYDYQSGRERLIGYRVTNLFEVIVRDLDAASSVIGAAAAAGGDAIRIHNVRFALEDDSALVQQARAAAWQDAIAKAQELADLAGVSLGPPLSIIESFAPSFPGFRFDEDAFASAALAPPIEPGGLTVDITIQVQFSILP